MFSKFRKILPGESKDLLSSAAVSLFTRILGAFSQFAFTVVLGRTIGADGLGLYALAITTCMFASLLGRTGLDIYALKFVSTHRDADQRPRLKAGWRKILLLVFSIGLMAALALFLGAPLVANIVFSKPELELPLRWIAIGVLPFSLLNLFAESLRALERIAAATLIQAGLLPAFALLFFVIIYDPSLGVLAAIFAYSSACIIVAGLGFWFWKKATPQIKALPIDQGPSVKEIFEVSGPMAWVAVTGMAMGLTDIVILGLFRPSADVGIYSAALRVSILISFLLIAIKSLLAPRFAALNRKENWQGMESLAKQGTLLMLLSTAPLLVLLMAFPDYILSMFGAEFASGGLALRILAVGQFLSVASGSVVLLLLMSGYEKNMRFINTISVLVNIILCFALIPEYGLAGAAIANSSAIVFLNASAVYVSLKHLRVSTIPGISVARK